MNDGAWGTSNVDGAVTKGEHVWRAPCSVAATPHEENIWTWHFVMQTNHVAQAVLLAMRGTYGAIVAPTSTSTETAPPFTAATFHISPAVHPELARSAQPLLEICESRALLWRTGKFLTSTHDYGVVNQAFGAALLDVCLGVHELVCVMWEELEASASLDPFGHITHTVLPFTSLLGVLRDVVLRWGTGGTEGTPCKGAAVLRLLEDARDSFAQRYPSGVMLVDSVIEGVSLPFLSVVEAWMYRGEVGTSGASTFNDLPLCTTDLGDSGGRSVVHHFPFFAWRLEPDMLPRFAQAQPANVEKLLESGRLALLMAESGIDYTPRIMKHNPHDNVSFADFMTLAIHDAWTQANEALLSELWGGLDLKGFLRFLQVHFLCADATWVGDFMERCRRKPTCSLMRSSREVSWVDLKNTFDDVMFVHDRTPQKATQQYRLTVEPSGTQLFRSLRSGGPGFAADLPILATLQLHVEVPVPLQFLFTDDHQLKYNFIFRLLFRIKSLKVELAECRRGRRKREDSEVVYLLHAMRALLDSLENYVCFEVIESHFSVFVSRAEECTTVSALAAAHDAFIHKALDLCVAFNEPCLKLLEKTLLSVKLCSEAAKSQHISPEMIRRFGTQFMERLQDFMLCLDSGSKSDGGELLQTLLRRLDFNGFYQSQRRQ